MRFASVNLRYRQSDVPLKWLAAWLLFGLSAVIIAVALMRVIE